MPGLGGNYPSAANPLNGNSQDQAEKIEMGSCFRPLLVELFLLLYPDEAPFFLVLVPVLRKADQSFFI